MSSADTGQCERNISHLKSAIRVKSGHSVPLEFSGDLKFRKNSEGSAEEFGRGAWSTVYIADLCESIAGSRSKSPGLSAPKRHVLAVKSPRRSDGHRILRAEALVLTQAKLTPGSEEHIVPFHGYIPSSNSIVMSAIPWSLSSYIEDRSALVQREFSPETMFDPVLGMSQWLFLAKKLVAGLSWLHNEAQIVHGDIKPYNILLRQSSIAAGGPDGVLFEPLFADFSSAHVLASTEADESERAPMAALTPPFTAPELLMLSSLSSFDTLPTIASDVFSMAITLLTAATGDLLLYPGTSKMQRLVMSRDGHKVLDFIRSSRNGCRAPRNGVVELVVKPAIAKDPSQRVVAGTWLQLVQTILIPGKS